MSLTRRIGMTYQTPVSLDVYVCVCVCMGSCGPLWDLISERICVVVNVERQIIFWSRLNCAMNYTYDVCHFKLQKVTVWLENV